MSSAMALGAQQSRALRGCLDCSAAVHYSNGAVARVSQLQPCTDATVCVGAAQAPERTSGQSV